MLAANQFRDLIDSLESVLLEIHRSKISLHHAKAGYDYPAIRLPFTFSALVGLSTRIFQTVYDEALAFLVVVSSASKSSPDKHENALSSAKASAFTRRMSPVRIRPSPLVFVFVTGEAFV
ncbi:MAG: hypothetical protein WCB79_01880 [Halobacteriota archaeon]